MTTQDLILLILGGQYVAIMIILGLAIRMFRDSK